MEERERKKGEKKIEKENKGKQRNPEDRKKGKVNR